MSPLLALSGHNCRVNKCPLSGGKADMTSTGVCGPDLVDQYRQAAGYVDRILKGEKPADLPMQVSNKYELAINLKTASSLNLTVPPTLLARVDKVVE